MSARRATMTSATRGTSSLPSVPTQLWTL
jgi:hypothetical protein